MRETTWYDYWAQLEASGQKKMVQRLIFQAYKLLQRA